MPRAKRSHPETDGNDRAASPSTSSEASTKKRKNAEGAGVAAAEISNASSLNWKFLARCRPREDVKREKREARMQKRQAKDGGDGNDDDDDDDDDDDGSDSTEEISDEDWDEDEDGTLGRLENMKESTNEHGNKALIDETPCYCGDTVEERSKKKPDWIWYMTEEGANLFDASRRRLYTSCPDDFGMYIYNDFEAYALTEIQENLIQKFQDAFASKKKKEERLLGMWSALEAAAVWLNKSGTGAWLGSDDGERVGRLVQLWGSALITMTKILIDEGLFSAAKDAPVKNLKLLFGLFLLYLKNTWCATVGIEGIKDETKWAAQLVKLAQEKGGFEINEPAGAEAAAKEFLEDTDEEIEDSKLWSQWSFANLFKKYAQSHSTSGGKKIGGRNYDIGKMTSAQRKQYAFDRKDPIKPGMLPPDDAKMCTA